MRAGIILLSLLAAVVLAPAIALAQSPVGALAGVAKDGDVAVIRNVATGFAREIKVGKSGKYQMRNLSPSTFEVTIRHSDGTTQAPKKVDVHLGTTSRFRKTGVESGTSCQRRLTPAA